MFRTHRFLGVFDDALCRWRRHRAQERTRRAIDCLSHHLRKDIGWPDALPDRRRSGFRPGGDIS